MGNQVDGNMVLFHDVVAKRAAALEKNSRRSKGEDKDDKADNLIEFIGEGYFEL